MEAAERLDPSALPHQLFHPFIDDGPVYDQGCAEVKEVEILKRQKHA